jgi:hypothetical protein
VPVLWPLLMGAIIGAGIAVRYEQAGQGPLSTYIVPFMIGAAAVLTVPYVIYSLLRRLVARAGAKYSGTQISHLTAAGFMNDNH